MGFSQMRRLVIILRRSHCGRGERLVGGNVGGSLQRSGARIRMVMTSSSKTAMRTEPQQTGILRGQLSRDFATQVLAACQDLSPPGRLTIRYPLDQAIFPPDIVAPAFDWQDYHTQTNAWLVAIDFRDGGSPATYPCMTQEWTPSDEEWEVIKQRSQDRLAKVTVLGVDRGDPSQILSGAEIEFSTSLDEVGAPLFFREVNLPFGEAVKDPAKHIRWRFGPISSKQPPPIVLEKLPVCGNCHSFSTDGSTFAMEVDAGNDKGSYTVASIEKEIVLDPAKIITWADYRREDGEPTFGMLCQVSPDGRYVVGTVKDRVLAVNQPQLAFSQLFFTVKGILAIYDRQQDTFPRCRVPTIQKSYRLTPRGAPMASISFSLAVAAASSIHPNCRAWTRCRFRRKPPANLCREAGSSSTTCTASPSITARVARPSRYRVPRTTG